MPYSKDSSNGKQVHANERIARAILILLFGSVVSGADVYMILKKNGKYNVKYRYIYITHEEVVFCLEGAYPKIVVTGVCLVKVRSLSTVSVQFYSFLYLQQSAEAKEDYAYGFSKMDALVSAVGVDEDIVYSKSIALQVSCHCYQILSEAEYQHVHVFAFFSWKNDSALELISISGLWCWLWIVLLIYCYHFVANESLFRLLLS